MERIIYREFCDLNDLHTQVKKNYSKFKHGDSDCTLKFALALASLIAKHIKLEDIKRPIVFIGAPFNKVPVASTFLTDLAAIGVTINTGKHIEILKFNREHSYKQDYSCMSSEDRDKCLVGESFSIDETKLEGKHVYFIDDIYITGAHERRMIKAIEGLKSNFTYNFVYFLKLDNSDCDPNIEEVLNHNLVNKNDLSAITFSGTLLINTRITKLLLSVEKTLFIEFLSKSSLNTIKQLLICAEANTYYTHKEYEENYNFLKESLTC